MHLSTADCICISGFWGLCSQTPTGALPLDPDGGLPSPRPPCAHPNSKPWLHHCPNPNHAQNTSCNGVYISVVVLVPNVPQVEHAFSPAFTWDNSSLIDIQCINALERYAYWQMEIELIFKYCIPSSPNHWNVRHFSTNKTLKKNLNKILVYPST